jgi:hypothetical protein
MGRAPNAGEPAGNRAEDPGFGASVGFGVTVGLGAPDSVRGTGVVRDSGGRDGVTLVTGGVAGPPEIFGATAEGVPTPGRVAWGTVCVKRSVGTGVAAGAGRFGVVEGASPEDGMPEGRLGFSEPPPEGTTSGLEFGGVMPMRSGLPPDAVGGAKREISGRLSTDSGGRASWTGTEGRYTATSAGRPPEGFGREAAKECAAAGLLTSRSSVRRISSRL